MFWRMGLKSVFLSARPIVLSLARSTMPSSTTLFSNNRFYQLLAPVNHGWTGLQSFDDPVVAQPFAGFREIGLQQDPRLQYPSGRALSFPDQPFKPFAFLAAQPHGSQQRLWLCCHNILLYRNLLRSHDYPLRQSLATKAND